MMYQSDTDASVDESCGWAMSIMANDRLWGTPMLARNDVNQRVTREGKACSVFARKPFMATDQVEVTVEVEVRGLGRARSDVGELVSEDKVWGRRLAKLVEAVGQVNVPQAASKTC